MQAKIFYQDKLAGYSSETDHGYSFQYDTIYLQNDRAKPISLTIPLAKDAFHSKGLLAFFDGLILKVGCLILVKSIGN
ncbi:HipA-like protein [Pedobacter sp. UYEF25]